MFKKRKVQKKLDLNQELNSILVPQQPNQPLILPKSIHSKKINKFTSHSYSQSQKKANPVPIKYGLIENQQIHRSEQTTPQNNLISLYVKKKIQQMASKQSKQNKNMGTSANQIIKMQKHYLESAQSKLAEYDSKQILKKFQKMSSQAIKTQIEARNGYLKNLLQNQHERMEYASKKQLKMMRQQRQREQKELISKYRPEGRRHFVSEAKMNSLFDK